MQTTVVDLDGVLVDFVDGWLRHHEKEHLLASWPKGEYSLEKVTGIPFETLPLSFWANLRPTEEAQGIIHILLENNCPILCATHVKDEAATAGKAIWHRRHFMNMPLTFCNASKAFAFDTTELLLIDDCDEELDAWHGAKIGIPRPWNTYVGDPMVELQRYFDCRKNSQPFIQERVGR